MIASRANTMVEMVDAVAPQIMPFAAESELEEQNMKPANQSAHTVRIMIMGHQIAGPRSMREKDIEFSVTTDFQYTSFLSGLRGSTISFLKYPV